MKASVPPAEVSLEIVAEGLKSTVPENEPPTNK